MNGMSVVDDSRSPVWSSSSGWLQAQDKSVCGEPSQGTACFAGPDFDTTDAALCAAAGCCMAADSASTGPYHCYAPSAALSNSDWYLFVHGMDHKQAVADYVAIAGSVPVPRRSWLGVSWSQVRGVDGGTKPWAVCGALSCVPVGSCGRSLMLLVVLASVSLG